MKQIKLGHQAPKGHIYNHFNYIEISGDLRYCKSHNFVYNQEIEEENLYNALPCHYTDIRFNDENFYNFHGQCYLHRSRRKNISLKACIRKTLSCKNIPIGTIVDFNKSWYLRSKKVNLSYKFLVLGKYDINSNCSLFI